MCLCHGELYCGYKSILIYCSTDQFLFGQFLGCDQSGGDECPGIDGITGESLRIQLGACDKACGNEIGPVYIAAEEAVGCQLGNGYDMGILISTLQKGVQETDHADGWIGLRIQLRLGYQAGVHKLLAGHQIQIHEFRGFQVCAYEPFIHQILDSDQLRCNQIRDIDIRVEKPCGNELAFRDAAGYREGVGQEVYLVHPCLHQVQECYQIGCQKGFYFYRCTNHPCGLELTEGNQ